MLRHSPRRTPALLAANRANALRSTGPRTSLGKQRSSGNAFRTGVRTSPRFWLRSLSRRDLAEFLAFRAAIDRALLAGVEGQQMVALCSSLMWTIKRSAGRKLRRVRPELLRRYEAALLRCPRCWHRVIRESGWRVTVTVMLRRRRSLGILSLLSPAPERRFGRAAHVVTRVTCTGHPCYYRGCIEVPLRTKPADCRSSTAHWRLLFDSLSDPPSVPSAAAPAGASPAESTGAVRDAGFRAEGMRTKPESDRKQAGCENVGPLCKLVPAGPRPVTAECAGNGDVQFQVERTLSRESTAAISG